MDIFRTMVITFFVVTFLNTAALATDCKNEAALTKESERQLEELLSALKDDELRSFRHLVRMRGHRAILKNFRE